MTTALEQHEHNLEQLVQIARAGEDVVLTKDGQAIAKITALPPSPPSPITNIRIEDAVLEPGISRMDVAAKNRKAPPGVINEWVKKAAVDAAAGATGKRVMTTDEIIEDLRSDRF